jgi:hypothetical protein
MPVHANRKEPCRGAGQIVNEPELSFALTWMFLFSSECWKGTREQCTANRWPAIIKQGQGHWNYRELTWLDNLAA